MTYKPEMANSHILPEKKYATGTKAQRKPVYKIILVAIIIFFATVVLFPPAALACGGCAENYPFLHEFPTSEELDAATGKFMQEYVSQISEDFTITEMWHINMERSASEELNRTIEVILGFKEEVREAGVTNAVYNFTAISYAEGEGFFFWPYTMASFNSREKLDAYIETYIVGNPQGKQVAGPPVPVNMDSLPQRDSSGSAGIPVRQVLFIAIGLAFVTLTVTTIKKRKN